MALVNYLTLILGELIKTTIVLGNLNKAWISAQRIQAVLAMPEEDPGQKTSSQVTRDTSDSTWQAQYLSYTYPGSPMPTIKQVSLQLQEGQWLGLTGVTGAGKTSLIKLLLGILPADQGRLVGPDAEDLAWTYGRPWPWLKQTTLLPKRAGWMPKSQPLVVISRVANGRD